MFSSLHDMALRQPGPRRPPNEAKAEFERRVEGVAATGTASKRRSAASMARWAAERLSNRDPWGLGTPRPRVLPRPRAVEGIAVGVWKTADTAFSHRY